jgi:hypothetical protein
MGNDKLYHQVGDEEQIRFRLSVDIYEKLKLIEEIIE